MESKIIRVAQGKIAFETAIPKGVFSLKLNTYGAKNVDSNKAFGKLHEGMIEITGLPNFSFVYPHWKYNKRFCRMSALWF